MFLEFSSGLLGEVFLQLASLVLQERFVQREAHCGREEHYFVLVGDQVVLELHPLCFEVSLAGYSSESLRKPSHFLIVLFADLKSWLELADTIFTD